MQSYCYSWIFSLCLAALFAIPHAAFRYRASIRLVVEFDIAIGRHRDSPPYMQLYFASRPGFSEQKSLKVILPEKGAAKHIQAYLPLTRLHALRLDYLNGPGRVFINNFVMRDPFGQRLLAHPARERWQPFQTQMMTQQGHMLSVTTEENANDPNLTLSFEPPLEAQRAGKFWSSTVFGLKVFAVLTCFLELLFFCIGKSFANTWLMKACRGENPRS